MHREVTYGDIARYFSNNCEEDEKIKIDSWRNLSEENSKIYDEYKSVWENTKVQFPDFNKEDALQRVSLKLCTRDKEKVRKQQSKHTIQYLIRIAASVLLIIGLYFTYKMVMKSQQSELITLQTKTKEIVQITLVDGSLVWVNATSAFIYPKEFNDDSREVFLNGEAYFDIAKNPDQPFIIKTGNSTTRVLGTKFNLRALAGEKQEVLTVTEGTVSFALQNNKKKEEKISEGEQCTLDIKSKKISKTKITNKNFNAWRTKKLEFQATPMCKVVEDISKYFEVQIHIEDDSIKKMCFTSTFEDPDLNDVFKVIEMTGEIEILRENETIVWKKKL